MHTGSHDKPVKSFYPLVNIRLISHFKYQRVKQRIHNQTQKAIRSESLSKLPMLDEERKKENRAKFLNSSHTNLFLGLRKEEKSVGFEGIRPKATNFWPKKLTKVRKDFMAFDDIRRRKLALFEASLLL